MQVHEDKCNDICGDGQKLIDNNNHNAKAIEQRCEGLREKLDVLRKAALRRKRCLEDNSAFLQFMWKIDVVESWIADKETQVRLNIFKVKYLQ